MSYANSLITFGRSGRTAAIAAGIAGGLVLLPVDAYAASIAGKWRGGGTVKLKDGGKETVRCSVTYGRIGGKNFSVKAKCASGAGSVDQNGTLTRVSKNRYVGTVKNVQYSVTATVTVNVNGGSQSVSIKSDKGTASLKLARR